MAPAGLTARERRVIAAVADAFIPRLQPGAGDDQALFAMSAETLGLPAALEEAIAGPALSRRQSRELRLFLRLLDSPLAMLLLAGSPRGLSAMSPRDRERSLLRLARSPVPQIRSGYQALKRLSTFLAYSLMPDGRVNPAWKPIGYDEPPRAPAPAAPLTLTRDGNTLDCDVCVIGSGAGGGVFAERAASAGMKVVVLEAGPADQAPDFDNRELVGTQRLYLDQGTTATRDLGVAILAGSALGGGTAINWQTSLRLPDPIRDEWAERSGLREFASDEFTRAFDTVCERLSVGTAESAVNGNNAPLARGAKALGWRWQQIERNSRGCDLSVCGYCIAGCRVGGKQSTANTFLVDAQRHGATTIVPFCRATRVTFEGGAASGVDALMRDEASGASTPLHVRARTVVVACGAIETPALLLRSGVRHPQLGRNLYLHPTSAVAGRYDQPVRGWMGAPQTVLCDELGFTDGNFGVRFEAAPVHPGLISLAQPWHGARNHRSRMQLVAHLSAFIVLSRDRSGGRVSIDREGRAVIDYRVAGPTQSLLRHGIAAASRLHRAAGASEIHTLHIEDLSFRGEASDADAFERWIARVERASVDSNRCGVFSAHQMGTCRMGVAPRGDVCDVNGAVRGRRGLYVADASLFPASSGVNPMITIMAMAHMIGTRFTQTAR